MGYAEVAFALIAANPFMGLFVAIPYATFGLDYPAWAAALAALPFAFLQVPIIAVAYDLLQARPGWRAFLERRRSARVDRLIRSGGAFWPTLLISPLIGPWLAMSLYRYAGVPARKVALPMFLGLGWFAAVVAAVCTLAPELVR